jgi:hypothetical protein
MLVDDGRSLGRPAARPPSKLIAPADPMGNQNFGRPLGRPAARPVGGPDDIFGMQAIFDVEQGTQNLSPADPTGNENSGPPPGRPARLELRLGGG